MSDRITRRGVNAGLGAALITPALGRAPAFAQGAAPIKIGFSMAETGPLAGSGKSALLAMTIWAERGFDCGRASLCSSPPCAETQTSAYRRV